MELELSDEAIKALAEASGKTEEEIKSLASELATEVEFNEEELFENGLQFLDELQEESGLEDNDFYEKVRQAIVDIVELEPEEISDDSTETLYGTLLGFYFATYPESAQSLCHSALRNAVMENTDA